MENESQVCSSSSGRGIGSEFQSNPWESEQRRQEMAIVGKVSFFKTPSLLGSLPYRKLMGQDRVLT